MSTASIANLLSAVGRLLGHRRLLSKVGFDERALNFFNRCAIFLGRWDVASLIKSDGASGGVIARKWLGVWR